MQGSPVSNIDLRNRFYGEYEEKIVSQIRWKSYFLFLVDQPKLKLKHKLIIFMTFGQAQLCEGDG